MRTCIDFKRDKHNLEGILPSEGQLSEKEHNSYFNWQQHYTAAASDSEVKKRTEKSDTGNEEMLFNTNYDRFLHFFFFSDCQEYSWT